MDQSDKDHLEYAWKHFSTIAEQRLKTFNFYIILLAGLTAATVSGFDKPHPFSIVILCGLFHIICPAIFYLIDERSRRLISIPKNAMMEIEKKYDWGFFREDERIQQTLWRSTSTYTVAFRIAFTCQACLGILVLSSAFESQKEPAQTKQPQIRLPAIPKTGLPSPRL